MLYKCHLKKSLLNFYYFWTHGSFMSFQTHVQNLTALQGPSPTTSKHGPSNTTLPIASTWGPPLIRLVAPAGTQGLLRERSGLRDLTVDLEGLPTSPANKSPSLSDSLAGGRSRGLDKGPPLLSSPVSPATGAQAQTRDPLPHPSKQHPDSTPYCWGPIADNNHDPGRKWAAIWEENRVKVSII